jgi:hypothetical protein
MNFKSLHQFLKLLKKENKFEIRCTVLGRLLTHGLRFGLAEPPRQRDRPNWPDTLTHAVTAHSVVDPGSPTDKVGRGRWREHRCSTGNLLDQVVAVKVVL